MTKAELAAHMLQKFGIYGAAETPSAEDAEYAETVIDNCQDELEQLEVALWTADDIPSYAVESFCDYCRTDLVGPFGQVIDDRWKPDGLKKLRYLTADKRSGVGKATYF